MNLKNLFACLAVLTLVMHTNATRNLKNGLATSPKKESCRKNNQEDGLSKKELKLIMRRLAQAQEEAQQNQSLEAQPESEQDSETE